MTDSLRQLAQEATSGPWRTANPRDGGDGLTLYGGPLNCYRIGKVDDNNGAAINATNAAYIAAANPLVILRLLDAVDKARTLLNAPRGGDVAGEDPGYNFWAAFDDLRASLAALEGMTP